jgi:DNA-binding MarR family transcriptional regulator
MMKHDMSKKETAISSPTQTASDRLDVQEKALAMISFISNRLVAGAVSPIRDFAGLSVNEARIVLLINADAIDTAAEATRLIGIDQAAVSRSVQRLIERGFIISAVDKRDAKRNLLELTHKGSRYAEALGRLNDEREDRLLSVLSTAERLFFLDILAKVLANVESANAVLPQQSWLGGEYADTDPSSP